MKVREALRAPAAEGVKVRYTLQLWFGGRRLPSMAAQSFSPMLKSRAFTPVTAIEFKLTVVFPVLVTATGKGELAEATVWLPKGIGRYWNAKVLVNAAPSPPRKITCGECAALSLMVKFAERGPTAAGEKIMVTEQLPPGLRAAVPVRHVSAAMAKSA